MSKCIPVNGGLITISETDFNCPACGEQYFEKDYWRQLDKSKYGLIYKRCKGCGVWMGISTNIEGDTVVWLKSEEKLNEEIES
jgi:predicted RNA-binding Zn-ribbon protein involved in translation (DUF1610 family)